MSCLGCGHSDVDDQNNRPEGIDLGQMTSLPRSSSDILARNWRPVPGVATRRRNDASRSRIRAKTIDNFVLRR